MAYFRCGGTPADVLALPTIGEASQANICQFNTDLLMKLLECICEIKATQSGSGTPSPANPRAINGHSELNLVRCGKNFFDIDKATIAGSAYGLTITRNGNEINIAGTANDSGNLSFRIISDYDDYSLSGKNYVCQCFDVSAGYTIASIWGFRTPTEKQIAIRLDGITLGQNVNLSLKVSVAPTAVDSYAPYNGDTFTVQFGQTVYGGVYDANGGKVNDSGFLKNNFVFGETALIAINQYGIANFGIVISTPFDFSKGAISNCLERQYTSGSETQTEGFFINASNELYVRLNSTRASTVNEFLTWANANLEILFTRATPIEIDVSELSVDTIVGVNNVFCDTGRTQAKFFETVGHHIA